MKWRKIKYILFHRSVLAGLALVAQVAVLFVMVNEFTAHFDYFYWFCIFVSFLATVWIVSDRSEPGYKIAWLVVILPFPVFGGILYLLLGGNRISERTRRKMKGIAERSNEVLRGDFKADRLTHLDEDAVGQIRYLERYASCPAYTNTRTEYFPVATWLSCGCWRSWRRRSVTSSWSISSSRRGSAGTPSWTSWSGRPPPGWRCG